jgi:hypothetical protein
MLNKVLDKLRREPVRVRIYTLATLVVGYLLARGYVSAGDVEFILGVASVVLGVEASRAKVSPVRREDGEE